MRLIAGLLLAAVAIAPCDVSANDVNPFVPESIVEKQTTSSATRKLPINETTRRILLTASRQSGLRVYVFSGGQPTQGQNRTGTHRHDLGGAADLYLVDPVTHHILDMRDPDDRVCMASFHPGIGSSWRYRRRRRAWVHGRARDAHRRWSRRVLGWR